MPKLLTILIPVYNEAGNVENAYARVMAALEPLSDRYDFEILFTDNHSTDGTFENLERLATRDPRVRVLRFSRNFGFQRSILTGYRHARGDAAIQLDCDLQDPPELIEEFVSRWEKGHKVVYGVRKKRREGRLISTTRRVFYWLIDRLSEYDLPRDAGDFRLVDRRILDELQTLDDNQPYLRGSIAGMGFEQSGVEYDRDARRWGESKFSLSQLMGLAMDGILNHSVLPLRIATFAGLFFSLLSVFGMIFYLLAKIFFGHTLPAGFTTITILVLLTMGLNALFLGIIGEYLGRIYKQVKKGPITIIEAELNAPG